MWETAFSLAPLLALDDGRLCGTTAAGGANQTSDAEGGTAFCLTPPASSGGAWSESLLWSFGATGDGQSPFRSGLVMGDHGVLYGTTAAGGGDGQGAVFSLSPPASASAPWTETILCSFGLNGRYDATPFAGVAIGNHGLLYGTTFGADYDGNRGTVFALEPPGGSGGAWGEEQLYRFRSQPNHRSILPHGGDPASGVVLAQNDSVIYGTASKGGAHGLYGPGIVYRLKRPATPGGAWHETVLHSFTQKDGFRPMSGLTVGPEGAFYGSTNAGGDGIGSAACGNAGCGTIYEVRP